MSDFIAVPLYRNCPVWAVTLACGHGGTITGPTPGDLDRAKISGCGYWYHCYQCGGAAQCSSILPMPQNCSRGQR